MKRLREKDARAKGFIIDNCAASRPVGYKGPRFQAEETVEIYTALEERLIDAALELRAAQKNYMADRGNDQLGKIVGEKAIVWGNPQKQATVALPHQFTLLRAAEGKTIEEQWRAEVQKTTGLEDFELKPHPLQEQLEKRLNEPFGDDSPGMMAQAFGGKYL